MNILIIGSGGRENALAWKFSRSVRSSKIFVLPGNPASNFIPKTEALLNLKIEFSEIYQFCQTNSIAFVFCGPEKPLEDGLVDYLTKRKIPIFGPTKAAALLETSKAFAKEIMAEAKIPTAAYEIVSDINLLETKATMFFEKYQGVVIKASALASGKGVFVCAEKSQISEAGKILFDQMKNAAEVCVLEEVLVGREASYFLFIGSENQIEIGFAVDHKRLLEGDHGPNTGGMGAYTPVLWLPSDASRIIREKIVTPLLQTLEKRAISYTGCLYVGLMWTDKGPKVIEYNVRLGDPETQALVYADDDDWVEIMESILNIDNSQKPIKKNSKKYFVKSIVLASENYPYGGPSDDITVVSPEFFTSEDLDLNIFGASIKSHGDEITLGSGRVLNIVARGESFAICDEKIRAQVEKIKKTWKNFQWRKDI